MKAVRIHSFGGPEVLDLDVLDTPKPKPGSVLIRIAAASINPVDYKIREGAFPKIKRGDLPVTLGRDVCGLVQESDTASSLEVIALLDWDVGGYAEYVTLPKALCVAKPKNLSRVEAASIPLAAMTAWQGLFQYAELKRGQRVLIHAGSGGVGHFAVQFAAVRGAHVVSTASGENLDFVRQLGAETVIDYKKQLFEQEVSDIDVVFDLVGGETRARSWQTLRQGGILVSTLGQPDEADAAKHRVRSKGYMTAPDAAQLTEIVSLIDQGKIRPVVTKTFRLDEAAAAQEYVQKQHPRGKTVLSVWDGK
jgi:NADPH:quinone reductase-like Zn-dependent oxidoreductase